MCLSSSDEDASQLKRDSPGSSDEFEREMESEVMGALVHLVSPAALRAVKKSEGRGPKEEGTGGLNGRGNGALNSLLADASSLG